MMILLLVVKLSYFTVETAFQPNSITSFSCSRRQECPTHPYFGDWVLPSVRIVILDAANLQHTIPTIEVTHHLIAPHPPFFRMNHKYRQYSRQIGSNSGSILRIFDATPILRQPPSPIGERNH